MSLVLLGCADQLIFYFYVVKYNSLDPLCSTIFHCAMAFVLTSVDVKDGLVESAKKIRLFTEIAG